jgi:uncharacterized membrane protein
MRKLVTALTLTLIAATLPAVADGPPPPVQVVATVLGLSEPQVAAWMEMLHAREVAVQPLQQELQLRQQTIATLLQSSSPDPATLGQTLIEARAIEQQIAAIVVQTNAQFEQSLTSDQRDRLQHIRQAAQVCPVVPAFQATGLI